MMPDLEVQLRSYGDQLVDAADPVAAGEVRERAPTRRRRPGPGRPAVALVIAAALVAIVITIGVRGGGRTTKVTSATTTQPIAAPSWSPRLVWSQMAVDARVFPLGTQITSLVSFDGRLIAAGRVEPTQCSNNTQAFCDAANTGLRAASMVVWASSPGGAGWARVWDSADPNPPAGTITVTPSLAVTTSAVYLVGTSNGREFSVTGPSQPAGSPLHYAGLRVWRSVSGLDWNPVAVPDGPGLVAEAAAGWHDRLVIAAMPYGTDSGDQTSTLVTTSGADWSSSTDGLPSGKGEIRAAAAGQAGFALGGDDGTPTVWTSPDGLHWHQHQLAGAQGTVRALAEDGSTVLALTSRGGGGDTSTIWDSADTLTWKPAATSDPLPPNAAPAAVVAIPGDVVLFGGTSQGTDGVWASPDGHNWTPAVNRGIANNIGPSFSGATTASGGRILLFDSSPGATAIKPTDPGVQLWQIQPQPDGS